MGVKLAPSRFFVWWSGAIAHLGMLTMYQYLLGLEGYIASVREHWIQLHPVVDLFILLVATFYGLPYVPKHEL